ncbi:MAG: cation transporter [Clostridium sp.]|nr:cation transporter [Clostridium sp.]
MENSNYKKVNFVLYSILILNFLVAISKIIVGSVVESNSIIADGFHSISDGTSNIIGILGVWLASRPVDKDHPYGHSKFEVITSFFIGLILLILSGKIVTSAISCLKNPVVPTITTMSLVVIIMTLLINIFISVFEYRIGKKLNSHILISDSMHTRSDILITIGVLISMIGIKLGLPAIIDPIVSIIVALFILISSCEIFKSTIDVLVDKAVLNVEDIRNILDKYDEIKCYHDIRSRGTQNNIHVDMHVHVKPDMSVEDAHDLSHKIEDDIREITNKNTQVIVHIEPHHGYCRR